MHESRCYVHVELEQSEVDVSDTKTPAFLCSQEYPSHWHIANISSTLTSLSMYLGYVVNVWLFPYSRSYPSFSEFPSNLIIV